MLGFGEGATQSSTTNGPDTQRLFKRAVLVLRIPIYYFNPTSYLKDPIVIPLNNEYYYHLRGSYHY